MLETVTRHRIKSLLDGGYPKLEVARLTGVSLRTVQRIANEDDVVPGDDAAERRRRRIGRPSVVQDYRDFIMAELRADPAAKSVELLERARREGYRGGKTTMYAFVASIRADFAAHIPRPDSETGDSDGCGVSD